jgi:hypothetical protein
MADKNFVRETVDGIIEKMLERLKQVDKIASNDYITGYKEALSHFNDFFKRETNNWAHEGIVDTLSQVISDTAHELGCENDNEAILQAIHDLKNQPVKKDPLAIKKFDEGYRMGYDTGCQIGKVGALIQLRDKLNDFIEEEYLNGGG